MIERILCAAIWFEIIKNDETGNRQVKIIQQPVNIDNGYCIYGYRHLDIFNTHKNMIDIYWKIDDSGKLIEGFLTSANRFVDRKKAADIAREANQIKGEFKDIEILFSEDLY